ncbi:MAG: hypothetical protein AAFU67_10205, partial [Bacteroidota bacterium]
MNSEFLAQFELSVPEYYEALRLVVDERLQNAPREELDAAVVPALESMSEEEQMEFFGAIASIAAPFVGKAVGFGARALGGLFRRKRRRRRRRRRRRARSGRSGLSHILKLMNDPRLKRLLAGSLLNRVSRRRIGRTRIRTVRRIRGRREFSEITLQEFTSLLSMLSNRFGGGATQSKFSVSVGNEFGEGGESSMDYQQME